MSITPEPSKEDDEIFNNYVTLIVALKYTNEGLKDVVKRSMKDLYEKIYNKCHRLQPCTDNCTAVHGNTTKNWCSTCKIWRKETSLFMINKGHANTVNWKLFDSKDWMQCHEMSAVNQIANIFVHKCKQPKKPTGDFTNMISLFENCSYFVIERNKRILEDFRKVRNQHFAHNAKFALDESDLKYCLKSLCALLDQPFCRADKKCKEMYERVCNLKNIRKRVQSEDVTNTKMKIKPLIRLCQNEPEIVVDMVTDLISNKKCRPSTRHRRYDFVLLVLLFCFYFIGTPWNTDDKVKFEKGKTIYV